MSKKVIGIDLASSMSVVSTIENGKPVVIVNEEGQFSTPSVIALKDGERKVGSSAKRQRVVNPKETVNLIKRFMGLTYDECGEALKHVQYEVVNRNGNPRVVVEGKEYSPEELSAMIIAKLKKQAEDYLGCEVTDAVISVPAFYTDVQRQAVATAASIANLNVLRIISEPTSAMLSSKIDLNKGGNYMVVDWGGATTDVSVAEVSDGLIEIKSNDGDLYNGGSNCDTELANYIVNEFKKSNGVDLSKDAMAMSRVVEAAEKAKIELSNSTSTEINLPYITVADNVPVHLMMNINRATFNSLIDKITDGVVECANNALKSAKLNKNDINGILLVGGSCRIPLLQEKLEKEFGVELIKSSNFDTAISEGCAIQANIIVGGDGSSDILLVDVTPLNLGIETMGGVMANIIEANTTIPCKRSQVFTTAQDNQSSVDINVAQGNRPMVKDNKSLGLFRLDGILPAKRGVPQINVEFNIDANGLLTVTAIDNGTKKEQKITIQSNGNLSSEEIERMKREAEEYAEKDKKEKEIIETINKGDSIVFANEKMIEEQGSNLSDAEKTELTSLVESMKTAVKDKNVDEINKLEKEINEKWNVITSRLYQTMAEAQNTTEEEQKVEENVQDATFEEVK